MKPYNLEEEFDGPTHNPDWDEVREKRPDLKAIHEQTLRETYLEQAEGEE